MPLYEYLCTTCQARFEWLQRMGEGSSAVRCPECGAAGVEKRLSTFATVAAGPGAREASDLGCGRPQCAGGVCAGAGAGAADWD